MIMERYIVPFLEMTSWRMYQPHVGGTVHLFSALIVTVIAVYAAIRLSERSEKARLRIISSLGWLLLLMEIYKQLFYYYIVNGSAYDFWYFPFHLCSVPMYLCILLPLVKDRIRDVILTFLAGFTFVSAAAALIYPEDMLKPYVTLTAHGFIWHGVLLFISLLIGISGMADLSWKGFLRSAGLFLGLAAVAVILNIVMEPMAAAGSLDTYPDMFYLSPYHASGQPFVDIAEEKAGHTAAMAAYTSGIIVLSGVSDLIFYLISRKRY